MGYWNPKGDNEAMVNIFKVGIKDVHRETDKVFIDQFLRGRVSQRTYADFIAQLYFVYEAMESELARNATHPVVGPVYFPQELTRLPSIERDLAFLYGTDEWRAEIRMLGVTERYVARIRDIGGGSGAHPELLMAHVFTRYMGDLFGGQILKRKWRKVFGFAEDEGVLFYTFDNIHDVPKMRDFIEARVNSLDMELEEKMKQLEEMKLVFKYNTDLVLEILEVAKSTPGGYLPPLEKDAKPLSWEEEIRDLGMEGAGGCVFATKAGKGSGAQCPVKHNTGGKEGASSCPISKITSSSLPKYGLLLCATLAIMYPIARKVWN